MKTIICILSLLFVIQSSITAQENTFSKIIYFENGDNISANTFIKDHDGNYLLGGTDGLLLKVSETNELIWSKIISDNQTGYAINFCKIISTIDSCYIVTGYCYSLENTYTVNGIDSRKLE